MSRVTHVKYRGKDMAVRAIHRMDFKERSPYAYACIENGNRPIPAQFYLDCENRAFFIEEGLVPLVLVFTGSRWMKVRP